MTIPAADGCPWPVDPGCLGDEWESDFDPSVQTRAIALASNTLFRLCGYRVGGCPVTIRPVCRDSTWGYWRQASFVAGYPAGEPFVPMDWNGSWFNTGSSSPVTHNPSVAVKLPSPAWSVVQVKVDGVVVNSANYWLSDDGYLIGLGSQTWPQTQNLDLPDTSTGTFSVTYNNTAPVDGQGAVAAGRLALEFAKACTPGKKCSLPPGVTNVVRQGVTYSLATGAFPNGETGLRDVDTFVALWNPNHRTTRAFVWSP